MNAQQLHLADGSPVAAFRCAECGMVYAHRDPDFAERCCVCQVCGKSTHDKSGARSHVCTACWPSYIAKIESDRMAAATLVEGFTGPLNYGDHYFPSESELIESHDRWNPGGLEFAYCCDIHPYSLDFADILQNLIENAGVEEMDESRLDGVAELEAAVKAFNAANEKNVYWVPDYKRKVRINWPPRADESADPIPWASMAAGKAYVCAHCHSPADLVTACCSSWRTTVIPAV